MTETKRDGPVAYGPAPEISHRHSADAAQATAPGRQAQLIASGFAAPPAGRRRLWAVVIPTCPACGLLHLHRSTGQHGGTRTGSCGAEYRVVLAGDKRGRWAS